MHFFNPAPVQRLVELVRTVVTEPDIIDDLKAFAATLDKVPVVIGDRAGFIANALLFGYLNHAARMYEQRYATREDLDAAMRYGCGYPMGPLALLDLIGLDTAYEILETMYAESRNLLHAPAPILKHMITAGLLGRKSGRGFYTYAGPHSSKVVPDAETPAGAVPDRRRGARHPARRRGRHRRDGGGHRRGVRESRAWTSWCAGAASRRWRRRSPGCARRWTRAWCAAGSPRTSATPPSPASPARRDWRTWATSTSSSRPSSRSWTSSARSSPRSTRSASRARSWRRPRPRCRWWSAPSATARPADVIGMHFFNPAPVMKLVEVVSTVTTSPDVAATALALCERIDKVPVRCGDRAGFIVNALLFPYLNDAVKMLEAHYATADDIDAAMTMGCALPMGPFELLDMVGLDEALATERALYAEFREAGFAPAPLLEHLVTAGRLGRKTGHGFRDYNGR